MQHDHWYDLNSILLFLHGYRQELQLPRHLCLRRECGQVHAHQVSRDSQYCRPWPARVGDDVCRGRGNCYAYTYIDANADSNSHADSDSYPNLDGADTDAHAYDHAYA